MSCFDLKKKRYKNKPPKSPKPNINGHFGLQGAPKGLHGGPLLYCDLEGWFVSVVTNIRIVFHKYFYSCSYLCHFEVPNII